MKKNELRVAIQEMDTYQFGLKNELHNKLTKVTSYVPKKEVIDLINQLEEPEQEKVIVPQFVADWIEGNNQHEAEWEGYDAESALNDSIHFTIYGLFANYPTTNKHVELRKPTLEWLNYDRSNYFKLVEAVRHGYTVEKEKLYRVILPDAESDASSNFLGLVRTGDNRIVISKIKVSTILHSDNVRFTEQEIKRNHEYLWQFAEEITK